MLFVMGAQLTAAPHYIRHMSLEGASLMLIIHHIIYKDASSIAHNAKLADKSLGLRLGSRMDASLFIYI
jgi:hypothetical protein